jgi:hypothetical protein
MLYGSSLAKILPNFCSPSFAVQHCSMVSLKFVVWLQYRYVTAVHKLATLE